MKYEEPKMEIVCVNLNDIIVTSSCEGDSGEYDSDSGQFFC